MGLTMVSGCTSAKSLGNFEEHGLLHTPEPHVKSWVKKERERGREKGPRALHVLGTEGGVLEGPRYTISKFKA